MIAGKPPAQRQTVRQRNARPRIDALAVWLDAQLQKISGKSTLAGAIRYARSRWGPLTRYLAMPEACFQHDGRLEISNNAAENAIRPIAIGRKNWLFAGSDSGGERAAVFYTLIRTARLNGVEPQAYLRDVLTRIVTPDQPAQPAAALEHRYRVRCRSRTGDAQRRRLTRRPSSGNAAVPGGRLRSSCE